MAPKKKPKPDKPDHPIFTSCVWRTGKYNDMTQKQAEKLCRECYDKLTQTTSYCEHIRGNVHRNEF